MCDNTAIQSMVEKFTYDEKLFTSVDIANAIKKSTLNMDIRNRDVRDWLKNNFDVNPVLEDYVTELIDVNGGTHTATLYRPYWKDAVEYIERDQKALSPAELDAIKNNCSASVSSTGTGCPGTVGTSCHNSGVVLPNTNAYTSDGVGTSCHNSGVVLPNTNAYTSDGVAALQDKLAALRAASTPVKTPISPSDTVVDILATPKTKKVHKSCYFRRIQIPGDFTRDLGWVPGQTVDTSKLKTTYKASSNLKVWYDGRVSIPRSLVGKFYTKPVNVILKDDNCIYFEEV